MPLLPLANSCEFPLSLLKEGATYSFQVFALSAGGKAVTLMESIEVHTQQVLETPLTFGAEGVQFATSSRPVLTHQDNMSATVVTLSKSIDGALELNSSVVISFDGFVDATFSLAAVGGSTAGLLPLLAAPVFPGEAS